MAATVSRRCRRVVLVAAIVDGVADWLAVAATPDDDTKPIGLLHLYLLLKRLDDLAYGIGLWAGVMRDAISARSSRRSGRHPTRLGKPWHSDVLIVGAGSAGSVLSAERLSWIPAAGDRRGSRPRDRPPPG